MKSLPRLASLCLALVSGLRGADPAPALPADWIDPETGHRVIRLSPDTGGTSLYFHQRSYTPEGDKILIRSAGGIATVDLTTLGVAPTKFELVLPGAHPIATAGRTREAYSVDRPRGALMAVHLDTKTVREVVKLPAQAAGGQFALNCDETLLVGIGVEPNLTFTPDGKWIIFSGNFHSPQVDGRHVTHVYAVELAPTR